MNAWLWGLFLAPIALAVGYVIVDFGEIFRRRELARRTILELLERDGPLTGEDLVARSNGIVRAGAVYVYLMDLEDHGKVESQPLVGQPHRLLYMLPLTQPWERS